MRRAVAVSGEQANTVARHRSTRLRRRSGGDVAWAEVEEGGVVLGDGLAGVADKGWRKQMAPRGCAGGRTKEAIESTGSAEGRGEGGTRGI